MTAASPDTRISDLSVIVVEDEKLALEGLVWLLGHELGVTSVRTASTATAALRILKEETFDVALIDIRMPGLDGLDLARVLTRFARPPAIIFVTAHAEHAMAAFDVGAVDYLLKPVGRERLLQALTRASQLLSAGEPSTRPRLQDAMERLAVPVGSSTRFISRSDVIYVEASGDYVRIHTADDAPLVRITISALEEAWRDTGFVRTHRGYLVAIRHVTELRSSGSSHSAVLRGDVQVPVSRGYARTVKSALVKAYGGGRHHE